ncbi:tat pathway signal sequence [Pseudothauera nasutitermitis]|uniref:Tat pathway signal sequence n=1 Tax=Pseudothauera nasutitermitis TaxID=2565930 RepID=A0A4S4B151_9RHOO|nr:DUF6622 family protein [Pseudothauera nasutitermitis]THF66271.1 tat pathway signal sequence [Pseudothauera nasutitermitis]
MSELPLSAILANTPQWVFVVLAVLLVLGWRQSRDRRVRRGSLLILPVAMFGLSLHGVVASFGFAPLPVLAWGLGNAMVLALRPAWLMPVVRAEPPGCLRVSGSWWPLTLMMAIFGIRYVIGYAAARQLPVVAQAWFAGSASLALGCLGGVFLARAVVAWRVR